MLPTGTILFPMIAGVAVSAITMETRTRRVLYTAVMLITDLLGLLTVFFGRTVTLFAFTDNIHAKFSVDPIGRYYMIVVMLLFTCVLFYSFEYMNIEEREHIFFAFYFSCFGALLSVALAANLVTLYLCFEMATLTSMPLVLHEMSREAVAAALKYLFYSIAGALMGLLAVFVVCYYATDADSFVQGGFLDPARVAGNEKLLLAVIFAGILGFGTKAGMYPMHGWLPTAHPIAPAPASALLSGIIAKAGIIAIIRLVFFSVGPDFLRGTWVQYAWMSIAMLTVFMGSMMAFKEKVTKKRLAYSTVSQISYISLGLSLLSMEGLLGGLLHIYKLGSHRVSELRGIGKQMPIVMWCFTFASLSLVGIPPLGGFISKWYIALAAVGDGMGVFSILPPVILLISALLTAGYLLPVTVDAFFPGKEEGETAKRGEKKTESREPSALMTVPLIVLVCAALAVGVFGSRIADVLGASLAGIF